MGRAPPPTEDDSDRELFAIAVPFSAANPLKGKPPKPGPGEELYVAIVGHERGKDRLTDGFYMTVKGPPPSRLAIIAEADRQLPAAMAVIRQIAPPDTSSKPWVPPVKAAPAPVPAKPTPAPAKPAPAPAPPPAPETEKPAPPRPVPAKPVRPPIQLV